MYVQTPETKIIFLNFILKKTFHFSSTVQCTACILYNVYCIIAVGYTVPQLF